MNPTKTIEQVRDSLRSQCEQVEKDENKFAEYAYHVPAWVLNVLADDLDDHMAERDALEDAIFQISVRLGIEREADMDAMDWHTDLISRAQYLANRDAELIGLLAKPSIAQAVQISCCGHDSDCAIHNAPAMPVGECDCSQKAPEIIPGTLDHLSLLTLKRGEQK